MEQPKFLDKVVDQLTGIKKGDGRDEISLFILGRNFGCMAIGFVAARAIMRKTGFGG